MKRILFLTSSLNRSGSEIVLYNLIKNLDPTKFQTAGIISYFQGELFSEIAANAFTASYESDLYKILPFFRRQFYKVQNKDIYQQFLLRIHKLLKPDIWYINTIMQPEVLQVAQENKIPTIIHSHELEQMLIFLRRDHIQRLISYPQLIIACSKAAKDILNTLGRSKDIEICYPNIDTEILNKFTSPEFKTKFRKKYSLPQDSFIWMMSGAIDPNKNPMRFIKLAQSVISIRPNTIFLWLGCDPQSSMFTYLTNFCRENNLSNNIKWLKNLVQNEYYEYFSCIDSFVLTSNRESFSLVLAEAMYLGKPVVCFQCGGPSELVSKDCGIIVDSYDESKMLESMFMIMNNKFSYKPEIAKAQASKYSIPIQSEIWNSILSKYIA